MTVENDLPLVIRQAEEILRTPKKSWRQRWPHGEMIRPIVLGAAIGLACSVSYAIGDHHGWDEGYKYAAHSLRSFRDSIDASKLVINEQINTPPVPVPAPGPRAAATVTLQITS
jgi:hypothetical protein